MHLDNLKELAKKFRLHKSIPNFFRDYTTEDSLVAVLKRYVRNNADFLSMAPSVAKARRAAPPQSETGGGGGSGGNGGDAVVNTDAPHNISPVTSHMDGGGSVPASGSVVTGKDESLTCASLAETTNSAAAAGVGVGVGGSGGGGSGVEGVNHRGVLSSEFEASATTTTTGGGSRSKESGSSPQQHVSQAGANKGGNTRLNVPRRPFLTKRPKKVQLVTTSTHCVVAEAQPSAAEYQLLYLKTG